MLMLSSAPARDLVTAGQHTPFSVCFFLMAWMAGDHPRYRRWAPLLLAASWLKFTITVPLTLGYLVQRRWREPSIALAVHVALLGLICWWTATSPVTYAKDYLVATRLSIADAGIFSDVWDSIRVGRALMPEIGPASAFFSLACLAASVWVLRRSEASGESLKVLAYLSFPACLVGFHLRYDFVVMAIPLAWVLTQPVDRSTRWAIIAVAGSNWFGARLFLKWFYHPVEPSGGYWDLPGVIGWGTIIAGTWLAWVWMSLRLDHAPAKIAPALHHLPDWPGRIGKNRPDPKPVARETSGAS